jgi:putative membrane protein
VLFRFLLRLVVMALVVGLTTKLVPGFHVYGGFGTFVWVGFLISLVNAVIGPILRLLALPLIVLTLGLFLLVINAAVLAIVAGLSSKLDIDSFGSAVGAGLIIAVLSWFAELVLPLKRKQESDSRA